MITTNIEQPKVFIPITIPNPLPSIKEQICIAPIPLKVIPDDPYNDFPFPAVPPPQETEVVKVTPLPVPPPIPVSAIPDPEPVYFEMNKSLVVPPLSPDDEKIYSLPPIGIPVIEKAIPLSPVPNTVIKVPTTDSFDVSAYPQRRNPDTGRLEYYLHMQVGGEWRPVPGDTSIEFPDPYGGQIVPLVTKAPDTLGTDFDPSKNDIPNPDEDWPNVNPDLIKQVPANEIPDDPNPSTDPKNLNIPIFGNVSVPVFVGILLTLIIIFKGK